MSTMDLYFADCGDILPQIDDASVDMIFADLPYGMTDCKWDCAIDLTWLFSEYFRLVKRNGAIVLTASQPFTSRLVYEHMADFKYEWIWRKNAGSNFGTVRFQPMKEHESVLVFSNGGGRVTYNPIMQPRAASGLERVQTVVNYSTTAGVYQNGGLLGAGTFSKRPDERYPSSIQTFNRERGLHPTQKPVALVEYMIRTHSNPGELILDNCMGSGTTGVACQRSGRHFIGIERDEHYFAVAKQRLEETPPETKS